MKSLTPSFKKSLKDNEQAPSTSGVALAPVTIIGPGGLVKTSPPYHPPRPDIPPVMNELTAEKDLALIGKYLGAFLYFASCGGISKLPSFTSPATPVFTKRVIFEKNIASSPGNPTTLLITPFGHPSNVLLSDGTNVQAVPAEAVSCYTFYRVVCARVVFRQVGITSINDALGTVIDAGVVPSNLGPAFLRDNLLSIQLAPGKLVKMVDGRKGITSFVLGSPEFAPCYTDPHSITVNRVITRETDPELVPAGSVLGADGLAVSQSREPAYSFDKSNWLPFGSAPLQAVSPVWVRGGPIFVQDPEGENIFIKTSPAPQGVTFRVVIEMVVEGPVKPELALSIPLHTPVNVFDFGRLKYAWENFVPAIGESAPFEQHIFAVRDGAPTITTKTAFASLEVPQVLQKFALAKRGVAWASQEIPAVIANTWNKHIKAAAVKDVPIQLPEYVKKAIDWSGELVTGLSSPANANRFARSAVTPLVPSSYAYFPMIEEENGKAVLGIICRVAGITLRKKLTIKALSLNNTEVNQVIYYDPDDFEKEAEFITALTNVSSLLYGPFRQPVGEPFAIKIFSDYKVAGPSFTYALMAVMLGVPSGGFYTGSFTIDENDNPVAEEMKVDVINAKLEIASTQAPLNILASNVTSIAGGILVGGVVNSIYGGKGLTAATVEAAIACAMLPFKARSIRATPLDSLNPDASTYLMNMKKQAPRFFIALKTMKPTKAYDVAQGDARVSRREFARSAPGNFTTMVNRKGNAWYAKTFYQRYPGYKTDPALFYFEYGDNAYVNPYTFLGHVKATNWQNPIDLTEELITKNNENIKLLNQISADDLNNLIQSLKGKPPKPKAQPQPVQDLIKPPGNTLPIQKAWAELQPLAQGLKQLVARLQALATEHTGNARALLQGDGGNLLALCNIPTRVTKEGDVIAAKDPAVQYMNKFVSDAGGSPVISAVYAAGWPLSQKPNPQLSTLQAAITFLKKYPPPSINPSQEEKNILEKSQNLRVFQERMEAKNQAPENIPMGVETQIINSPYQLGETDLQINTNPNKGGQGFGLGGFNFDDE